MKYRDFSKPTPRLNLSYDVSARQVFRRDSDKQTMINRFFGMQSHLYCDQLDEIISQIDISENCSTGIVMPCTHESAGIQRAILSLQATLTRREDVSLLVVLNANIGSQALIDNQFAIHSKILPLKQHINNLQYISLNFDPHEGCLGRARKYGLDIFLRHFWKTGNVDGHIIFLEADMVSCDEDLVEQYESAFDQTGKSLLQGRVHYPSYCSMSTACRIYLSYRDIVPRALAARPHEFPLFMGPMVIGRNFAVQAGAAAAANSIDPFAFDGAEDDIIFGTDVALSANDISAKGLIDAAVVTNPRRELHALHMLHETQGWDQLMSYDCFLKESLFRPTDEELLNLIEKIVRNERLNGPMISEVIKPSIQWISRCLRKEMLPESIVKPIIEDYFNHKNGYWGTEAAFERAIDKFHPLDSFGSFEVAQALLDEFSKQVDDSATVISTAAN